MKISNEQLQEWFSYHPADTEDKRTAHENVRTVMRETAEWVNDNVPDSREKSLALTSLQHAMMECNAAIAIHGTVPQEEETPVASPAAIGLPDFPEE